MKFSLFCSRPNKCLARLGIGPQTPGFVCAIVAQLYFEIPPAVCL